MGLLSFTAQLKVDPLWKLCKDCKEVNSDNTYFTYMSDQECATKRIPVCPSTWESVYELRKPGQTFDSVIKEMVAKEKHRRLFEDADRKMREGHFVEF
jgi:hypothetical protein